MFLRRTQIFSRSILLFLALILFTTIAYSDNAPVPSRESAAVEESKLKFDKLQKKPSEESQEKAPPSIEEKSPENAAPREEGTPFSIKSIKFLGNRSFSDAELQPLVAHLLKGPITLGQVQDAAAEIKKFYRAHGFIATYVYIPRQQLIGDELKIDILEGRFGVLSVTGNKWYSADVIKKQFRLHAGDVLKYEDLRRDLARLNSSQDIKAKIVMEPGEDQGSTNLTASINDRAPVHLTGEINNQGTKSTGNERYSISAAHNNVFGAMDRLNGALQYGVDSLAVGTSYSVPLNYDAGTRLTYSFVNADVDVKGAFTALQVKGWARTHNLTVLQPVVEQENFNVDLRAGLDVKSIENSILGSVTGKDELRILNPGMNLDFTDPQGKTFSTQDINFGLGGFGGSSEKEDATSRAGTGGSFFVYRGMVARYQKLPGDAILLLKGNVQFTPDSLAPSEQIRLGGAHSIRGYQEGDYSGDYGGYANCDVIVPPKFIPENWKLPYSKESMRQQVQMIGFLDWGTARIKSPAVGEIKSKDLGGAGAGLRVHLYDNFYGRVEWGFVIGDRPADNRRSAFHFTVSYEFM